MTDEAAEIRRQRVNAHYQWLINVNNDKIDKINDFVNNFQGLIGYIDEASEKLKTSSGVLANGVIINGQPYDKGEFLAYSKELKSISDEFRGIMKECDSRVQELETQNSGYRSRFI